MQDIKLKQLNQFTGTQQYFNVFGANVTDGVMYIMENGYSWFVTDSLSVIKFCNKLKEQEFLSINLKVNKDKTALLTIDDGNNNVLYTQNYKYTDAEVNINLFFCNNVLMLNTEY